MGKEAPLGQYTLVPPQGDAVADVELGGQKKPAAHRPLHVAKFMPLVWPYRPAGQLLK